MLPQGYLMLLYIEDCIIMCTQTVKYTDSKTDSKNLKGMEQF